MTSTVETQSSLSVDVTSHSLIRGDNMQLPVVSAIRSSKRQNSCIIPVPHTARIGTGTNGLVLCSSKLEAAMLDWWKLGNSKNRAKEGLNPGDQMGDV